MSNPPVTVVEKRRGPGCCGCGCGLLVLIVAILIALLAAVGYYGYRQAEKLTSTQPMDLPAATGDDATYASAQGKYDVFLQAVHQNQPATLQLTSDELSAFIAHMPGLAESGARVRLAITSDQADLQCSFPLGLLKWGVLDGRYANTSARFGLGYDPVTHEVQMQLKGFRMATEEVPEKYLAMLQNDLQPVLNQQLKMNPDFKTILERAKTVAFRDGQLVIETE